MGAVVDGAGWCQTFVDLHDPEAVRILDFAHAAEYLSTIAQMPGADGPLLSSDEHVALRRSLKQTGPAAVLPRLREVVASQPRNDALTKALAYLEARVTQMQYPQFVAEGWPIGSGMVESANKLVVEDRLKGAGMHGAETNVNPLLALRNAIGNDRWDETWTVIEHEQRRGVCCDGHAPNVPHPNGRRVWHCSHRCPSQWSSRSPHPLWSRRRSPFTPGVERGVSAPGRKNSRSMCCMCMLRWGSACFMGCVLASCFIGCLLQGWIVFLTPYYCGGPPFTTPFLLKFGMTHDRLVVSCGPYLAPAT